MGIQLKFAREASSFTSHFMQTLFGRIHGSCTPRDTRRVGKHFAPTAERDFGQSAGQTDPIPSTGVLSEMH
ncbi:unnamed protein product [Protopolystoma xenopodis]|uniref:Uncharacterized protein n=1 Tax=Protopolystoma xenopodis TaxID=117903 RepID=A0A3S5FBR8_9PLAT|nr:unnamed protein product [Protopolystoma xenopodis]